MQSQGQILNDPSFKDPVLTGLACFGRTGNPSAITLEPIDNFQRVGNVYEDCVQGGPVLVTDSKATGTLSSLDSLKSFSSGAAERSFIARDGKGQIVLGVTSKVSLFALQEVLLLPSEQGGFGARTAIGLTGRNTAGLMVATRSGSGEVFVRGAIATPLPNAIIVGR